MCNIDLSEYQDLYNKNNTNIQVLDTYIKNHERRVKIQLPDGRILERTWKNEKKKDGKREWNYEAVYTSEDIINEYKKYGYEVLNINEYINCEKSIYCKDEDGYIYCLSLKHLQNNDNDIQHRLFNIYNQYKNYNLKHYCELHCPNFTPLETFDSPKTPIKFQYSENNHIYEFVCAPTLFCYNQLWKSYMERPYNISYESAIIYRHIKAAGKKIECEYSFDNLGKGRYRYDFAVFRDNTNELECLIEYDSILHFNKNNALVKDDYKAYRYRDMQKNDYCLAHQIPLYRISCWDLNSILCYDDIIDDKYRVKSRYHNIELMRKHGYEI